MCFVLRAHLQIVPSDLLNQLAQWLTIQSNGEHIFIQEKHALYNKDVVLFEAKKVKKIASTFLCNQFEFIALKISF